MEQLGYEPMPVLCDANTYRLSNNLLSHCAGAKIFSRHCDVKLFLVQNSALEVYLLADYDW